MESRFRVKSDMVSPHEWVNNPWFSGPWGSSLLPFWQEHFYKLLCYDKSILYGSFGSGKNFIGYGACMRFQYTLAQIVNLREAFSIGPSDDIISYLCTIDIETNGTKMISQLADLMLRTPYFQEVCPARYSATDKMIELPDRRYISIASAPSRVKGDAVPFILLDEANFFKGSTKAAVARAKELSDEGVDRILSRFAYVTNEGVGKTLSHFMVMSSAASASSFVEQIISKAVTTGTRYVVQAAVYDVKPQNFSKEKFKVFVSNGDYPTHIVPWADKEGPCYATDELKARIELNHNLPYADWVALQTKNVIEVPLSLLERYEEDVDVAVRNLSGRCMVRSYAYMRSLKDLDACTNPSLINCVRGDNPQITTHNLEITPEDVFDVPALKTYVTPDTRLYFHIDLALRVDPAGFALVGKSPYTKYQLLTAFTVKPESGDVMIDQMAKLILYLDSLGFNVVRGTFDDYQSTSSIQILNSLLGTYFHNGRQVPRVSRFSIDTNPEPFDFLKTAFRTDLVELPSIDKFRREMSNAIYDPDKKKVDHPAVNADGTPGTIDLSQSIAGAFYNAFLMDGFSIEELRSSKRVPRSTEDVVTDAIQDAVSAAKQSSANRRNKFYGG